MTMLYDLFFAFLQTGRFREARKIIEVNTHTHTHAHAEVLCPSFQKGVLLNLFKGKKELINYMLITGMFHQLKNKGLEIKSHFFLNAIITSTNMENFQMIKA